MSINDAPKFTVKKLFLFQRLVLSFNEIKESGANAIAYAVADKPALEKLDLDGRSTVNAGPSPLVRTLHSYSY